MAAYRSKENPWAAGLGVLLGAIAAIEAHLAVPRPATILAEAARDVSVIILTDTIGESAV